MGNPAQMRSGEILREKLRNAAQMGPQPNTPPLMMGAPPEGLIGGMVNRPGMVDITPPAPRQMPGPVSSVAPGLVSNIVNTGITGRRTAVLPEYQPAPTAPPVKTTPDVYTPQPTRNPVQLGGQNRPQRSSTKKNKAFTMPSQNKGMLF